MSWLRRRAKAVEAAEPAPPPPPSGPPILLLIPELAGVASFRIQSFFDVDSAAAYLQTLIPAVVPTVHVFWALNGVPGESAAGSEAMVLVRSEPNSDLAYVVSFVDFESALAFARFEVKRGMDLSLLMLYWAELVTIAPAEDGYRLSPAHPPSVRQGITAAPKPAPAVLPVEETQAPAGDGTAEPVPPAPAPPVGPARQGGATTNWVTHAQPNPAATPNAAEAYETPSIEPPAPPVTHAASPLAEPIIEIKRPEPAPVAEQPVAPEYVGADEDLFTQEPEQAPAMRSHTSVEEPAAPPAVPLEEELAEPRPESSEAPPETFAQPAAVADVASYEPAEPEPAFAPDEPAPAQPEVVAEAPAPDVEPVEPLAAPEVPVEAVAEPLDAAPLVQEPELAADTGPAAVIANEGADRAADQELIWVNLDSDGANAEAELEAPPADSGRAEEPVSTSGPRQDVIGEPTTEEGEDSELTALERLSRLMRESDPAGTSDDTRQPAQPPADETPPLISEPVPDAAPLEEVPALERLSRLMRESEPPGTSEEPAPAAQVPTDDTLPHISEPASDHAPPEEAPAALETAASAPGIALSDTEPGPTGDAPDAPESAFKVEFLEPGPDLDDILKDEKQAPPEAPDYLKAWQTEELEPRPGETNPPSASPLHEERHPFRNGQTDEQPPAEIHDVAASLNGSTPESDAEPPETIPGEESLSPEMARFLRSRRRDKKDSPFRGFDSPPGRF